jgi:hypothetical protein
MERRQIAGSKVGSNFRKRETGNREVRDKIAVIWQKGLVI